jgi:hypothetical protein
VNGDPDFHRRNRIGQWLNTLTDFDSGLNRPPLLAPAPSVNAAAFIAT